LPERRTDCRSRPATQISVPALGLAVPRLPWQRSGCFWQGTFVIDSQPSPRSEHRGNLLFQGLAAVLDQYVSPITTRAILDTVLRNESLDPNTLQKKDIETIFQNGVFRGIRMFCDPKKLPEVMLALAEFAE
jgi:hypothetical protein